MGELTVTTFVSLDGVMQAPGGPSEDPSGGFEHGGWIVPHADEGMGEFIDSVFRDAGAFLLGRGTYEIFAAHWPRVTDPDDGIATALNSLPKYVVSATLKDPKWNNSSVLRGDLSEEVARLKREVDGEVQVHGSAGLVQSLLERDLIDELRVLTFPVVLGTGKRLFGPGARPRTMRLVESRTTSAGTVISVYRPAGALQTGSFELGPEGSKELYERR